MSGHKPIELKDIVGYTDENSNNLTTITDNASLAEWNEKLQVVKAGGYNDVLSTKYNFQPLCLPNKSVRMPGWFKPIPPISYQTSIDILITRIPNPPPPPPPQIVKKVLVHNESLERKSANFLEGIYDESDMLDTSLRTARKKMRSIKSTVLKSKDETSYAVDTVQKAKARDFKHIFNPPIRKKPLYDVVDIVVDVDDPEYDDNATLKHCESISALGRYSRQSRSYLCKCDSCGCLVYTLRGKSQIHRTHVQKNR